MLYRFCIDTDAVLGRDLVAGTLSQKGDSSGVMLTVPTLQTREVKLKTKLLVTLESACQCKRNSREGRVDPVMDFYDIGKGCYQLDI